MRLNRRIAIAGPQSEAKVTSPIQAEKGHRKGRMASKAHPTASALAINAKTICQFVNWQRPRNPARRVVRPFRVVHPRRMESSVEMGREFSRRQVAIRSLVAGSFSGVG